MMELVLDPALLAGVIGLAALAGWIMGRAQVGRRMVERHPAIRSGGTPQPARAASSPPGQRAAPPSATGMNAPSPCQQRAIDERRSIFADPVALAELHDEATSIRRDERVLEQALGDAGPILLLRPGHGEACRYLGLSGQPTCPGPITGACQDGGRCAALRAEMQAHAPHRPVAAH
jgi:hypothetical protein